MAHVVTKAAPWPRSNVASGQGFAAVGADESRRCLVVARAMHQLERRALGKLPPPIAPLHERQEHRKEVKPLFRESVFLSSARTSDVLSKKDLLVNKLVQTVGQDVASDAQVIQHFGESPATEEDLTNDKQCPPLADTATGYGCARSLPAGAAGFTTAELKANFLGTATTGELQCVASLLHGGRTTQVWDAVVKEQSGRALAVFRCTQIILWPRTNDDEPGA